MKYATYNIEENKIEVFNSILGIESVNLNGRKISSGFSWFGKDHCFKIGIDNYLIRPQLSFSFRGGVKIKVYKNGEPIMLENQISKQDKSMLIFRTITGVCLGLGVGLMISFGYQRIFDWFFQAFGH